MQSLSRTSRFLLISIIPRSSSRDIVEAEIREAVDLITEYGGRVVKTVTQNESHYNTGTFVGKGKVEEIGRLISADEIDVVVINENLTSSQLYTLQSHFSSANLSVEMWDRTELILHIFEKHATTAEAKLQIKLANIRHKGPELHGMGKQMSQQGAGIGTRGKGETNTEIMKRHWRREIGAIEDELGKITSSRSSQMEYRKRMRLPTLSIVGYTNAGKSTLFNTLTKKDNLVKDAPFATLDSGVGKLYLHGLQKEAFVTDTIGFIQNIPTDLIEAFRSTLLETVHADLLLHVVDLSDPLFKLKIETVEEVLGGLELQDKNRLMVFNKTDLVDDVAILQNDLLAEYEHYSPLFMSARNREDIPHLIQAIEEKLREDV